MSKVANSVVGAPVLDEVLSQSRKEWLYKRIKGGIENKLFGGDVNNDIADELASEMYERLVGKPVDKAFPKGLPVSDGQWIVWLKADAKWTKLRYLRRQWRHPVASLQARLSAESRDDECGELTLEDMVVAGQSAFRPWIEKPSFFDTPESHYELPFVHQAFKCLCQGTTGETQAILDDIVFREMDSDEVAERYGIKANAVYAKRFRFNAAVERDGRRILELLEAVA